MDEQSELSKKIIINGINNKYQIKKLTKNTKTDEATQRLATINWCLTSEEICHDNQLKILNNILLNKKSENAEKIKKIVIQQIKSKISGYKHQDLNKQMLDNTDFVNFSDVIKKMIDTNLSCYYCKQDIDILYNISREKKQWTIDRIDNDKGHNKNNFHLACLECNLKRRKQSDDKFLFTKQLNIIKHEN